MKFKVEKGCTFLKNLGVGSRFEIPNCNMSGEVLSKSPGGILVKYDSYKDVDGSLISNPNHRTTRISTLTSVRRI